MAEMTEATRQADTSGDLALRAGTSLRTGFWILASAVCYYLATRIAWMLCFPESKVSLFFFPHAVLVSLLLIVPTRHWWAYALAAASSHFIHSAGGLAATLRTAVRGFRCRESRVDGRRHSLVHQVTVPSPQSS